jgi:hypothetical protein
MRVLCSLPLLVILVLAGCDETLPPPEPASEPVPEATQFDASTAGEVRGQLTWQGELPRVPPYQAPVSPLSEQPTGQWQSWPNPHAPRIDERTRGVAGAVVFLRGIDPRRVRPWDHPAVRVEIRDYQLHVCQGERDGQVGFVRRGQTVEMVSRQPVFHSLQARGDDFFARTFPDPDRPCNPCMKRAGVVELQSGAGHFWMRGYLFVDDHPYFALTDAQGRFTLPAVPPGSYDLVCWLPSWREADYDLDADTVLLTRLAYEPPVRIARPVQVAPRQTQTMFLTVSIDHFVPRDPARRGPISRSPQFPRVP